MAKLGTIPYILKTSSTIDSLKNSFNEQQRCYKISILIIKSAHANEALNK